MFSRKSELLPNLEIAFELAKSEIVAKHKKTTLGVLWLFISNILFISSVGIVWSKIWGQSINSYLPFIALSHTLWIFSSSVYNESASILLVNSGYIRDFSITIKTILFSNILKNFLLVFFQFPILFYCHFFMTEYSFNLLIFIFGFFWFFIYSYYLSLFVSILSVRYRDISVLVNVSTFTLFFITPVLWEPSNFLNEDFINFLLLNPFAIFLELTRGSSSIINYYSETKLIIFLISHLIIVYTISQTAYFFLKKNISAYI